LCEAYDDDTRVLTSTHKKKTLNPKPLLSYIWVVFRIPENLHQCGNNRKKAWAGIQKPTGTNSTRGFPDRKPSKSVSARAGWSCGTK
jgi:hypothetical protein